jgi:hypothetical protein
MKVLHERMLIAARHGAPAGQHISRRGKLEYDLCGIPGSNEVWVPMHVVPQGGACPTPHAVHKAAGFAWILHGYSRSLELRARWAPSCCMCKTWQRQAL